MTIHYRRLLPAAALLAATDPASAAVVFNSLSIGSNSTAQAKAPSSAAIVSVNTSDPRSTSTLPAALTASSSASVADTGTDASRYTARSANVTGAAFAGAGTGVITFTGDATASATAPGLAQAASSYFAQYVFTLTTAEAFDLRLAYSSQTLGCCGNQVSLQRLDNGQFVFSNNNYGAANTFNYSGNLQAGQYRLSVSKGEYYGFDAPSFNGSGTGTRAAAHNDRVSFQIGALEAAVPEPASWALMIAGFGLVGGAARRRGGPRPDLARAA